MRTAKRGFWFLVFFASAISRLLFMAGKMYFSAKEGTEYMFRRANTLPGIVVMAVLIAGDVIANLIVKVPAIYSYFLSEKEETAAEEAATLGWRGRVVETTLKSAGAGYGLMQVGVAYFSTSLIVKTAAELLGTTLDELPMQAEIPLQVALIIAAILASDTYLGYDYQLIKKNAHTIAEKIDKNDYSTDKMALTKTLLCSSLNLATYPALAYFLAKPTLSSIPGVNKYVGDVGINIGTGIACLTTLLTVVSWLPSIYQHFAPKDANVQSVSHSAANLAPACEKRLLRGIAYPSGTIDSIGEGLTLFMSVLTVGTDLTNVNKYSWIIAPAALAGLNGFSVNLLFSTLPGVHKLENSIDQRHELAYRTNASEDPERAPLLVSDAAPVYTNPVSAAMLIFAPAATPAIAGISINAEDSLRLSQG